MSKGVSKGVRRGMTFNNVRLTMSKGIPKSLYLKTNLLYLLAFLHIIFCSSEFNC